MGHSRLMRHVSRPPTCLDISAYPIGRYASFVGVDIQFETHFISLNDTQGHLEPADAAVTIL